MRFMPVLWLLAISCSSAVGQGIMIPVSYYAVQGAPFTLTSETRDDSKPRVGPASTLYRILRDSAGRQRYEAVLSKGDFHRSTPIVYDVVAGKKIMLDMEAKTAVVAPMQVGESVVLDVSKATSLPQSVAAADQTLLGNKDVAGLEAWGARTVKTTTLPNGAIITQTRDLWLSTHYGLPVLQVVSIGHDTFTQTLKTFDPGEPDPALFQIPASFKVSDAPPAPTLPPGVLRSGGDVLPPLVLKTSDPSFTEEARRKKIKGEVLVSLYVDEAGQPQDIKVVRGLGYGLDEEAVKAVQQYRFKPGRRDGVPVKVEISVGVYFQVF